MPRQNALTPGTKVYMYDGSYYKIDMNNPFIVVKDFNNDEIIRLNDGDVIVDYTAAFFFTEDEASKLDATMIEVRIKKSEFETIVAQMHNKMTKVKRGMEI